MKRINILQFFSKKGALVIGVIVGIIIASFGVVIAHAEAMDIAGYEYPVMDGEGAVACYFADKQEGSNVARQLWYIKFDANAWADRENLRYAVLNVPLPGGMINKTVVSNVVYTCVNTTYRSWVTDNPYQYQVGATGNNALAYAPDSGYMIPYFSNYEKGLAYVNGTLYDGKLVDITECDNWNEYKEIYEAEQEKNREKSYDATISIPDDFGISACDTNGVQAVWKYNDQTVLTVNGYPLQYDVKLEYLYSSMSATSGFLFGYTGSTALQGGSVGDAVGKLQTVEAKHTVEEYLTVGESLVNDLLVSCKVDEEKGSMSLVNTYSGIPKDYSKQFVSSGNSFFSGATNSTHAIFIGCQATVTPYYIDDSGVKHYGSDSVTRKFINGITSVVSGGNKTVVVGTDGEGNKYYQGEYIPSYETGSGGSLGGEDLANFVKNGFGLLGNNGFFVLSQRVFGFFPSQFWVLIFLAITVSISIIVLKAFRGV